MMSPLVVRAHSFSRTQLWCVTYGAAPSSKLHRLCVPSPTRLRCRRYPLNSTFTGLGNFLRYQTLLEFLNRCTKFDLGPLD
jgi:hypothetical protein